MLMATMFAPPLDLLTTGGFEEVQNEAQSRLRWLVGPPGSMYMHRDLRVTAVLAPCSVHMLLVAKPCLRRPWTC